MPLSISEFALLKQIREYVEDTAATDAVPSKERAEAYCFVVQTLARFEHHSRLPKPGEAP